LTRTSRPCDRARAPRRAREGPTRAVCTSVFSPPEACERLLGRACDVAVARSPSHGVVVLFRGFRFQPRTALFGFGRSLRALALAGLRLEVFRDQAPLPSVSQKGFLS